MSCETLGYGIGPWGGTSWGEVYTIGEDIPTADPFDIFCYCGGAVENLLTADAVDFGGDGSQFVPDTPTGSLILGSGGSYATYNAWATISALVPQAYTFETVVRFLNLPLSFGSLTNEHIYFGAADTQGNSVGLFVSKIGLMYAGSVHHTVGLSGDLVIDSPLQALPNSDVLTEEGVDYVIRLVTSYDTGTTYIYWTRLDELDDAGHQLRYVLPGIKSVDNTVVPPDQVMVSLRGTLTNQSAAAFYSLCLGTGAVIPNIAPIADAGTDQAVRTCAIVQLDGTRSFDPEGAALSYQWRLLDTPLGSQYIFDGLDGRTYPLGPPTGFTTKFYSVDLSVLDGEGALSAGDVLIVKGEPFTVTGFGSDVDGFFVTLSSEITDSYATATAFKYLYQNGISGPTTAKPTFLPDKPGLYKFDLVVNDGSLSSPPSVTIINVTESPIPRGLTPDLRFLWGYLSDFWNLVEDRERIEVFWSGLAQIAASELLNLWQLDYSKSLRDIQRTFQRRWLRYDLLMEEDPIRVERTKLRAIFGGRDSASIPTSTSASLLYIQVNGTPFEINVPAVNDASPAEVLVPLLQPQLDIIDPRLKITALASDRVRINAPFAFEITPATTCTYYFSGASTFPQGTGTVVNERAYRVDANLAGIDIKEGDFLILDGVGYRIARVATDAGDPFQNQRITTVDTLPTSGNLLSWMIGGTVTSETLDFWHGAASQDDYAFIDVVDFSTGTILTMQARVLGANEQDTNKLAVDLSEVGAYLLDENFGVYFRSVLRRHYLPIDRLVQDVPYLQEKINNKDDQAVLRRNVDFFIEAYRNIKVLRFVVGNPDVWQGGLPPNRLWAETTYLDNRPMIEANFGIPAGFTLDDFSQLPSNVDYLSAVRGLWFAYFNGPTLFNLRAGVQILLGLPFAEEAGTIEEIRDDFSSTTARILVRDSKSKELVRSYTYPAILDMEVNPATGEKYKVGDTVAQFAPLVEGSEVIDWVKDPKWIEGYLNQGVAFEVEKFFKFLVRVDADAFNLSALLFAMSFIKRVKPTYTYPIFIVKRTLAEAEVSVTETAEYHGKLTLWAGPAFGADGQAQMWDQPRPGGGGFWNHADTADPNAALPTVTPTNPVDWANDQYLLSPKQTPLARLTTVFAVSTIPSSDSIFYAGMPVFTNYMTFVEDAIRWLRLDPGIQIERTKQVTFNGSINKIAVYYRGVSSGVPLTLVLQKNGSTVGTFSFTPVAGTNPDAPMQSFNITVGAAVSVTTSDTLSVFVKLLVGGELNTFVEVLGVTLGIGTDWSAGVALPAGTYNTVFPL